MQAEYRIEKYLFGWAIFGAIPVDDLAAINKLAGKKSVIAAGVASALGATIAFSDNEKTAKKWEKEIEAEVAARYGAGSPQAWLLGTDTGESSKTIFSVMTIAPGESLKGSRGAYPLDADDFGRCFRLLERFPEWRARLPEVAKHFPAWKKIVEAWPEMEALFAPVNGILVRRRRGEAVTPEELKKLNVEYSRVSSILYRISDELNGRESKK